MVILGTNDIGDIQTLMLMFVLVTFGLLDCDQRLQSSSLLCTAALSNTERYKLPILHLATTVYRKYSFNLSKFIEWTTKYRMHIEFSEPSINNLENDMNVVYTYSLQVKVTQNSNLTILIDHEIQYLVYVKV